MRKFTFFLVAALVMFICQVAVQAQTTGSISGVVVDQNGAIVAGATVTVKNAETGDERKGTSNDSGGYSFNQLAPGVYTVTVENKGFKKVVNSDVKVSVSVETKVDLALQIGLETETVTVTTGQDVINTSSPTLTNVINTRQVVDLPLGNRNPVELAALQAGIAVVGTDTRGASVSGLRQTAVNMTQDGINAMD
ncbi:MAG TPA: carboxypeptidase-like regulatory domain-containing protein, partial [Pyrinomonadaceae bacterium]|nr:carboxypeptidase-like regulatory domain-containing protein [Pyrinomonadaceae bacterium]